MTLNKAEKLFRIIDSLVEDRLSILREERAALDDPDDEDEYEAGDIDDQIAHFEATLEQAQRIMDEEDAQ